MTTLKVANLPGAKDESSLEKQLNIEELENRREVLGVGLDSALRANFIEFRSNLAANKLERIMVKRVPEEALTDENHFGQFITPLIGDSELLERPIVLFGQKEVQVVVLRQIPLDSILTRLPAPPVSGRRTEGMKFESIKRAVSNRGIPPESFLQELVEWGRAAPEEIFKEKPSPPGETDIYSAVKDILGPFGEIVNRKACMLEVMRVLAGFESSWRWTEGIDRSKEKELQANPMATEAGAWQVSADSLYFGEDLKSLVKARAGNLGPVTFQAAMKADHPLAMEYVARLLRHTIRHHGPVKRHEINEYLSRDSVNEFEGLLGS